MRWFLIAFAILLLSRPLATRANDTTKYVQKQDVVYAEIVKEGGGHPWLTIPIEVGRMADWFDKQLK
jgi:hypothetical protein